MGVVVWFFPIWFIVMDFPLVRHRNYCVLAILLNKSARRKRRKGQSFWEWLWYKRFRDVLPLKYRIIHLIHWIMFLLMETAFICLVSLRVDENIIREVFVYCISFLAFNLTFYSIEGYFVRNEKKLAALWGLKRKSNHKKKDD
ncbi:MAG: hypothetical protein IJX38_05685 [Clostridia bacterium]|nr:hypothetical protein [Clostridia bacterium]